jgi:hypothetical protein
MATRNVSRRELFKLLGAGAIGVGLAACGSEPPASGPAVAPSVAPGDGATAAPAGGAPAAAGDKVQLEVKSVQPEYSAQSKQVWDVYVQQNPNVEISLVDVNEDTQAAYDARIAAGNPADIDTQAACTKANYQQYTNLLDIPDFKWELYHKDAKTGFEQIYGVANYVPMVNTMAGYYFSFIFYKDKMDAAGLNPRADVKTMDDLETFLAALKTHVDENPDLDYVMDTGWHPWVLGTVFPSAMSIGLGQGKDKQRALFTGEIKWTDLEQNPFVPYFQLYKDWYDKGYTPEKWWTRNWDEYENGNIAQKSILTFHGPWQWDKIEAGNPEAGAQLDGFLWPVNEAGQAYVTPTATYAFNTNAAATYSSLKDKANAAEARKAMLWWYSPESVKLQAEAIGSNAPAMDMSSVGEPEIRQTQWVKVIKPARDGEFGEVTFDDSLHGADVAARYFKDGSENVMESDAQASLIGDYLEGTTTLEQLLDTFQKRWDAAYQVS